MSSTRATPKANHSLFDAVLGPTKGSRCGGAHTGLRRSDVRAHFHEGILEGTIQDAEDTYYFQSARRHRRDLRRSHVVFRASDVRMNTTAHVSRVPMAALPPQAGPSPGPLVIGREDLRGLGRPRREPRRAAARCSRPGPRNSPQHVRHPLHAASDPYPRAAPSHALYRLVFRARRGFQGDAQRTVCEMALVSDHRYVVAKLHSVRHTLGPP
jgi:hypothetical protein